jgi:hypothetical protein
VLRVGCPELGGGWSIRRGARSLAVTAEPEEVDWYSRLSSGARSSTKSMSSDSLGRTVDRARRPQPAALAAESLGGSHSSPGPADITAVLGGRPGPRAGSISGRSRSAAPLDSFRTTTWATGTSSSRRRRASSPRSCHVSRSRTWVTTITSLAPKVRSSSSSAVVGFGSPTSPRATILCARAQVGERLVGDD